MILSIFVGIVTFWWQWQDDQAKRKREAVMDYAAIRHGSTYADASQALYTALLDRDRLAVSLGNQQEAKVADAQAVIKTVGAGRIDGLATLYGSIITCRDEAIAICDPVMVNTVFKDDIEFFYCSTAELILPEIADRMGNKKRYERLATYFDAEIGKCS